MLEFLSWLRDLTPAGWHEGLRGAVAGALFLLPIFAGLLAIWRIRLLLARLGNLRDELDTER
jgi:hypothetical protein